MNLFAYIYRTSSRQLWLATVLGTIGGLSGAALVTVISKSVNDADQTSTLAAVFFGLCLLQLLARFFSEFYLLNLTQTAVYQLRLDLSRKLLATPLKKLQELGKHRLLAMLTGDIERVTQAFQFLPLIFGNCIIILGCLCYLAWLSWQALIVFAMLLAICMVGYRFAERRPFDHLVKVRAQMDVLFQHFRSLIEGSKELKLNSRRGTVFVDKVLASTAFEYKRGFTRGMLGYMMLFNVGSILFSLNVGIFLFVVPHWIHLSPQSLTAITLTFLYLTAPISDLMNTFQVMRQAMISFAKIQQLETSLDVVASTPDTIDPFKSETALLLEMKGVCHHYSGSNEDYRFMLGPIDLTINQGEILFIVGGNGSGKTTLAMLLLGLYEPEAGTIFLNGKPVTDSNRDNYRQYFSAVFADFHLFEHLDGSGRGPLDEQATRYITALDMEHKVKVVDGRFSTTDLSTGQRKRLALVSAYLEDRSIYLFDEWAADQDPVFKRVFYTELLPELKARGKSVVVITHDDAYFRYADRIIKLKEGRLHDSTMAAPPISEGASSFT